MIRRDDLARDLQHLGASRIEAILVSHLLIEGAASTADIIETTGLRQPEVSVGMRELRERGWIQTKTMPREGKGRPMHGYELALSKAEIAAHYKAIGQRKVEAYNHAMKDLDAVLAS